MIILNTFLRVFETLFMTFLSEDQWYICYIETTPLLPGLNIFHWGGSWVVLEGARLPPISSQLIPIYLNFPNFLPLLSEQRIFSFGLCCLYILFELKNTRIFANKNYFFSFLFSFVFLHYSLLIPIYPSFLPIACRSNFFYLL